MRSPADFSDSGLMGATLKAVVIINAKNRHSGPGARTPEPECSIYCRGQIQMTPLPGLLGGSLNRLRATLEQGGKALLIQHLQTQLLSLIQL